MPVSDTHNRDEAARLAPTNLAQAYHHAVLIKNAWFQCQAFAYIACYTPWRNERDTWLAKAFSLANSLKEPNQIVSVSAWPLKVAAQYWTDAALQREVDRLAAIIVREPSPVRRADGLRRMIDALVRRPEALPRVLEAFVEACFAPLKSGRRNRRGETWFVRVLPVIACHDYEYALRLCERIGSEEKRAEARKVMSEIKGKTFGDLPEATNLPCKI